MESPRPKSSSTPKMTKTNRADTSGARKGAHRSAIKFETNHHLVTKETDMNDIIDAILEGMAEIIEKLKS